MELTGDGLLIHANVSGVCISTSLRRDLFIPWNRMDLAYYLTRQQVRACG